MQKSNPKRNLRKPQRQDRPGIERKMKPVPVSDVAGGGTGKLSGKIALITGGDSGIGKAVAILFAKEGADIAISYLNEHVDARDTKKTIESEYGRQCILLPGDIGKQNVCKKIVSKTIAEYGRIDVLVNNAAIHFETKSVEKISPAQLQKTFATNIFSFFYVVGFALPHMKKGSVIINTSSVTAYRGSASLMDYSATKGAIISFTRSLSANLVEKGIRVNAVAPGPIWTPLVVSSFKPEKVAKHGSDVPMKRAGEPVEVAYSYLFLACDESSYITGQVLHPNGGEIING